MCIRDRALGLVCLGAAFFVSAPSAHAQQVGTATGLRVPRYVSLKSDRVNLREGPSKEHRTSWVFQRAGLPVEITAEFETWRKIRDSEGSEAVSYTHLDVYKRQALRAKRGPADGGRP